MSAENPRPLAGLLDASLALLRASATFKLVTTEGADQLSKRAQQRREAIEAIRQDALRAPKALAELEQEHILETAEAEADVQAKLAGWLRQLAGGE